MRVVEPHQFKRIAKRQRKLPIISVILGIILMTGLVYAWQNPPNLRKKQDSANNNSAPLVPAGQQVNQTPKRIKTFTGEDFKKLFQTLAHPNTQPFAEPPEITGNLTADARIRSIAEARGYKLTSIPVTALIKTDEATPNNDDLLQPLAYESWKSLKAAGMKEGLTLTLYSAYRSPEFQRDLFLSRLYARGVSAESIAAGNADSSVEATLQQTAVPGYSRHHSGYVVDFQCGDGSGSFGGSSCFRWLSANNYLHAKEHGWIPSYPDEAGEQGPEPEEWEYVWVGLEALSE